MYRFGAAGCDGGTDNAAYEWMMEYGLPTEAEYGPYTNKVHMIVNTEELPFFYVVFDKFYIG